MWRLPWPFRRRGASLARRLTKYRARPKHRLDKKHRKQAAAR